MGPAPESVSRLAAKCLIREEWPQERKTEGDAIVLEGLKIVEFATYVAAPSAAAVMSDWGADVIKVESGRGDPTRRTFAGLPHLEGNPVFEF